MTLEKSFDKYTKMAEDDIKNFINQTPFLLKRYLPREKLLGYENDFEFIRGWILGQIQASCIDLFREVFGRKPSEKEYSTILELIMKYKYDIQNQIKSFYFDHKLNILKSNY